MINREEVAEKLRKGGIARNEAEAYVLLLHCIGIRPQLPAVNTYKPALERLAGLIDPTCELKKFKMVMLAAVTAVTGLQESMKRKRAIGVFVHTALTVAQGW